MKKQLVCALSTIAAITAMLTIPAYADIEADYTKPENKVTVTGAAENARTVLITNKESDIADDNIFYADQSDSGTLNTAVGFAIKANPAPGTYYISIGFDTGEAEKTSFTITDILEPDVQMIEAFSDNPFKPGDSMAEFTALGVSITENSKLVFKITDDSGEKYLYYSIGNYSGDVNLAVRLTGLKSDVKDVKLAIADFTAPTE